MTRIKIPDLNDIVSEGRNTAYGYYRLRHQYRRVLVFSFIAGILIFLVLVLIPFLVYLFGDVDTIVEDNLYSIEYTFIPPPEDMPLLPPGPPPEPEVQEAAKAPKVIDTIEEKEEEKQTKPVEEPVESQEDTLHGKGNSYGVSGGEGAEGLYATLDVHPRYPGGDKERLMFLRSNVHYPQEAIKQTIQGVVKVVFVVEPDGSLSNFQIAKSIGAGCDEEAMRVARLMPRWEPGRRNGKTVRVLISMPIVFRLPAKPGK